MGDYLYKIAGNGFMSLKGMGSRGFGKEMVDRRIDRAIMWKYSIKEVRRLTEK